MERVEKVIFQWFFQSRIKNQSGINKVSPVMSSSGPAALHQLSQLDCDKMTVSSFCNYDWLTRILRDYRMPFLVVDVAKSISN